MPCAIPGHEQKKKGGGAGPLHPTNRPGVTAYGATAPTSAEVQGYVLWRAAPLHVIGLLRHPDYPVASGHVSFIPLSQVFLYLLDRHLDLW